MQVQYQMEDLTVGQKVTGTVKAVHDFGVFVDIGAPRDALLNTERFAVRLLAAWSHVPKGSTRPQESHGVHGAWLRLLIRLLLLLQACAASLVLPKHARDWHV